MVSIQLKYYCCHCFIVFFFFFFFAALLNACAVSKIHINGQEDLVLVDRDDETCVDLSEYNGCSMDQVRCVSLGLRVKPGYLSSN